MGLFRRVTHRIHGTHEGALGHGGTATLSAVHAIEGVVLNFEVQP